MKTVRFFLVLLLFATSVPVRAENGSDPVADEPSASPSMEHEVAPLKLERRGICGRTLAWLRRPRYTVRAPLTAVLVIAVGLGGYKWFLEDRLALMRAEATVNRFDKASHPPIESQTALDKQLAEMTRLYRTDNGSHHAKSLLDFTFRRDPEFQKRFERELGSMETVVDELVASDLNGLDMGAIGKKRALFDRFTLEAARRRMRMDELDWTGESTARAAQIAEASGRFGEGLRVLKDLRAGKEMPEWKLKNSAAAVILELLIQDEVPVWLRDRVYAKLIEGNPGVAEQMPDADTMQKELQKVLLAKSTTVPEYSQYWIQIEVLHKSFAAMFEEDPEFAREIVNRTGDLIK